MVIYIFSECIQKYLKAGNTECPQCGVQIQGKSLTRNSSYATMVQCISKIKNLLNGVHEPASQVMKIKEEKDKENAELLISVLDGFIDDTEEDKNAKIEKLETVKKQEERSVKDSKVPSVSNPSEKQAKVNKNKKVIEAKLPKKIKPSETQSTTKAARYGLLLTGLSEDQKATINSNLQKLSKISGNAPFKVIKDYSPELVTHIICACAPKSHCPRTLKYLLGVAGKSWIISFDWILECLEAGKLLKEDKYVVIGDEAVRMDTFACEKSRADPGRLFDNRKFYLSGSFTGPGPSKSDLINLIQVAGGTISKKVEADAFIISDALDLKKGEYSYTWLFDSISCYELK